MVTGRIGVSRRPYSERWACRYEQSVPSAGASCAPFRAILGVLVSQGRAGPGDGVLVGGGVPWRLVVEGGKGVVLDLLSVSGADS
jgi:hypothetical protein